MHLSNTIITPLDALMVTQPAQTSQFIATPPHHVFLSFSADRNERADQKMKKKKKKEITLADIIPTLRPFFMICLCMCLPSNILLHFPPLNPSSVLLFCHFPPCPGSSLITACSTQAEGLLSLSLSSLSPFPPFSCQDNRRAG